jgi:hypothetical protein
LQEANEEFSIKWSREIKPKLVYQFKEIFKLEKLEDNSNRKGLSKDSKREI